MSSTFSLSRLGKLITKQFFENLRLYTFSVLALFGLLALIFAFWIGTGAPNYNEVGTYFIFLFGLFIAGLIFASMSFDMLGSKDKGIYWLGIPATHLEKLVCTIFYTTVVFTLAYCGCFYIIKSLALVFLKAYMQKYPEFTYTELTDFTHGFGAAIPKFIYAYFAVQALYMLGSVYFTRFSFVITTVAGAVVIFAFAYYITHVQKSMMGEDFSWDLVSAKNYKPEIKDGYLLYSVSSTITNVLTYIVKFGWAPLFWVITWFRLKEKEI